MAHLAFVHANTPGPDALRCAKGLGHYVSFVRSPPQMYPDNAENARTMAALDHVVDVDDSSSHEQVTAALRVCHEKRPLDAALSTSEFALEAVALACQTLGLPFASAEAVLTARRKHLCRQKVAAAGIPSVRFEVAQSTQEALAGGERLGYPLVAKPVSGSDSLLAAVARTPSEMRAAADKILAGPPTLPSSWREQFSRGILIEERLSGHLVSVELAMRGTERHVFCVSGRFRSLEDEIVELGSFIPAALPPALTRACADYAIAVCEAIGLDFGIFHIELICTERGPILVEVNPRLMGGGLPHIYRCATGYDINRALIQLFTKAPITGHPLRLSGCAAGRRIRTRHSGRLPPVVRLEWLDDWGPSLARFDNYALYPERAVEAKQVLGRIVARAEDHVRAIGIMNEILRRLEPATGLDLMVDDLEMW